MERLVLAFIIIYFATLFSGCSTVKVAAKVKHPSEINMTSYTQVAVSGLDGNYGSEFSDMLKSSITRNGDFTILDCSPIKRRVETQEEVAVTTQRKKIKKARRLSKLEKGLLAFKAIKNQDSELATQLITGETQDGPTTVSKTETKLVTKVSFVDEPNPNCTSDKLVSSALLNGYYKGTYSDKIKKTEHTCKDDNKKKYTCYRYTRTGTLSTTGNIDVVNAETNEIIRSKPLNNTCSSSTYKMSGTPDEINVNSLKANCMRRDASLFVKTITPWTETVMVPYTKDSDLPQLESGINYIKLGKYPQAIAEFKRAIKSGEASNMKPKIIAKAYWNLGLAYEYSWQFEDSIRAFESAYLLNDKDQYLTEKSNVKKLMASRKKLLSQTRSVAATD